MHYFAHRVQNLLSTVFGQFVEKQMLESCSTSSRGFLENNGASYIVNHFRNVIHREGLAQGNLVVAASLQYNPYLFYPPPPPPHSPACHR
jgi:hypothetical protein